MNPLTVDLVAIVVVAKRLDLREPNREAVESIAFELARYFDLEHRPAPFEAVVDSATDMGKTYIFAGAFEYPALAEGVRTFILIAPSRIILETSVAQLTPGNPKSITNSTNAPLLMATADNFNSPSMAADTEDDSRVRLFTFTVQSLLKPTTKAGRRTRDFQEGVGSKLYQEVREASDLVVFGDEHLAYYGRQVSAAGQELEPWALIGLTATPHKSTPTTESVDKVEATGLALTIGELREYLTSALMGLSIVAARHDPGVERRAIQPIVDDFINGSNGGPDTLLSAHLDRATALLFDEINKLYRRVASAPQFKEVASFNTIDKVRRNTPPTSGNRHGRFDWQTAYDGWRRSVCAVAWYNSKPIRDLAVLLDESDKATAWCRLVNQDLTIVWAVSGERYNADFLVVTPDDTRCIVEVKGDYTITSDPVLQKRETAKRWVNKVGTSGIATDTWRYLLVTESDILATRVSLGARERLWR